MNLPVFLGISVYMSLNAVELGHVWVVVLG
jgi:hypothetical protein